MSKLQSIRGFTDIIDDIDKWHHLEATLQALSAQYGYQEIRTPLLEDSRLFERSIGVTSDIVHKEMYTFTDRNEQSVSLRPEGTASVVRACIQGNLLYDQARKWFYISNMFRRERPQRGRLRQFHQFGMECLGYDEPYADIEQLVIINEVWRIFGLAGKLSLEMNYLGSRDTRIAYGEALKAYYQPHLASMSELNQKRWEENTLRLLDAKDAALISLNQAAPSIDAYYTDDEKRSFAIIQQCCQDHGIDFTVNNRLMRGLDYYTGLIYEWKSDELGAQSTVCGGGRYDLLFENLGEKRQGACGFSIGIERLLEICPHLETPRSIQVHLACMDNDHLPGLLQTAQRLRQAHSHISLYTQLQAAKMPQLIKRAVKKSADFLVILENPQGAQQFSVKDLNQQSHHAFDGEQLANFMEQCSC